MDTLASGSAPINSLPTNLLVKILSAFEPHPLLRVISRVCRRWRAAAPLAVRALTLTFPNDADHTLAAHLARFSHLARLTLRRVSSPGFPDKNPAASLINATPSSVPITLPASLRRLDISAFVPIASPFPPALHTLKLYTPLVSANHTLVAGVASSLRVLKIASRPSLTGFDRTCAGVSCGARVPRTAVALSVPDISPLGRSEPVVGGHCPHVEAPRGAPPPP